MLKLNIDASLFILPNRFSFALVVRDHLGQLVEARASCREGLVSPDVAEAIGLKEALSWIKDNSWSNVVVESDALVVVQEVVSL